MDHFDADGVLLARCVVCRGNIFEDQTFEVWEAAYYCERHSLPYLRERARAYAALTMETATPPKD